MDTYLSLLTCLGGHDRKRKTTTRAVPLRMRSFLRCALNRKKVNGRIQNQAQGQCKVSDRTLNKPK